MKAVMLLWN